MRKFNSFVEKVTIMNGNSRYKRVWGLYIGVLGYWCIRSIGVLGYWCIRCIGVLKSTYTPINQYTNRPINDFLIIEDQQFFDGTAQVGFAVDIAAGGDFVEGETAVIVQFIYQIGARVT